MALLSGMNRNANGKYPILRLIIIRPLIGRTRWHTADSTAWDHAREAQKCRRWWNRVSCLAIWADGSFEIRSAEWMAHWLLENPIP